MRRKDWGRSVVGNGHFMTVHREELCERVACVGIVFHDEDAAADDGYLRLLRSAIVR